MGSNPNSPTPDPDEAKGAFRKPENDAASRKYRRRSSASPSASPEEILKQKEPQLDGYKRRKHSSRDDRVSGRDKSSDHTRGGRYVDEEDRNYSRLSSRSGRESRGGGYTEYKERGGDYNRSRDNYHYKDRYNRDRSDDRSSRDKYEDRDRRGRDRDCRDEKRNGGRSSRDYRSDRVTTCEESRRNQDDSKAENRTKHLNDENKKYDEGDSKGSRERFQDDVPAKRNEEIAVKRTKFSSDRNDATTGSSQGQDVLVNDTPGQAVVNMPEPAGNLDAAKVAAMKAAELGQSSFFNAIQRVIESRWNKSNTPLHCLAHSLVPKYYTREWIQGGGNNILRVAPNEDEEVSLNRNKCLRRLFPNSEDVRKVFLEYGSFSGNLGSFSETHVMAARVYEDPLSWWSNYGSATPLLQNLAFKLLSQPASSSCCDWKLEYLWWHSDNQKKQAEYSTT